MSLAPMPPAPAGAPGPARRAGLMDAVSGRGRPPRARPRWLIGLFKRLLPLLALGLLALVVLYPELAGNGEGSRISYRRVDVTAEGGQLTDARYQGVDDGGQPFTVTAAQVRQAGPARADLERPRADMELPSGGWVLLEAARGVYEPPTGRLDLSGEVLLYRDDGTLLQTDAATVDFKAAAAAGHAMVHGEGPFGILDAQGFTITDRGAVIRFHGPARIVLKGGGS